MVDATQDKAKEEHRARERPSAHALVVERDGEGKATGCKDGEHANGRPSRVDTVRNCTQQYGASEGTNLEESQHIGLLLLLKV